MKTTVILIRIACCCILIHLLGHTAGHFSWRTPENKSIQQVVNTMTAHSAPFMGTERSLADFYDGYSLLLLVFFALTIWLLWIISNRIKTQLSLKTLLWPFAIGYLGIAVIEFVRFFPFAAVMSLVTGIFLLLAVVRKVRSNTIISGNN
jgi:hypothetical protein